MKIHKYEEQVKGLLTRKAPGHEYSLRMAEGYLDALVINKLITRKEYNILRKVYASEDNCDGEFYIKKDGSLGQYDDDGNEIV